MKLPHLTLPVLLDRGFALLLYDALGQLEAELHRDLKARRLSAMGALTLKPLTQLLKRLPALVVKDDTPPKPRPLFLGGRKRKPPKPPKPHKLRVEYDEMAVVRLYYARLLATHRSPTHYYLLATALACFHKPSLTLESHIKLPTQPEPGCQASFL